MNRRLETITYLQMKLFACSLMQIRRQTFSQNISTLLVCAYIVPYIAWTHSQHEQDGEARQHAWTGVLVHVLLAERC